MDRAPTLDVLIVDDDPAVADSTADILAGVGLSCAVAPSLPEALAVLADGTEVGVVILDHHLAEASEGGDCAGPDPMPPVILMSGIRGAELHAVQRRHGPKLFAFLGKPVPPGELIAVVRRALGTGRETGLRWR